MNRTISNMAALIVAANALLLTGGVSAQSLTTNGCAFYNGENYELINFRFIIDNDWSDFSGYDINSVRVRKGCVAAFQFYRDSDEYVFEQRSTAVDDPFFHIPFQSQFSGNSINTICACQDDCVKTTIIYGQERNVNERSTRTICLNIGEVISIPNLGKTTFDNELGFVTIKADRWYDFNNDLPPPKYEIRTYHHRRGRGGLIDTHVMQGRKLTRDNGRTWQVPRKVKFSASSLYVERTF